MQAGTRQATFIWSKSQLINQPRNWICFLWITWHITFCTIWIIHLSRLYEEGFQISNSCMDLHIMELHIILWSIFFPSTTIIVLEFGVLFIGLLLLRSNNMLVFGINKPQHRSGAHLVNICFNMLNTEKANITEELII